MSPKSKVKSSSSSSPDDPQQLSLLSFRVPDSVLRRCRRMADGWDDDATTVAVLEAYRQFMDLKVQHEDWDDEILFPPHRHVDLLWRQHVLETQQYVAACQAYCGRLIGHNPDKYNTTMLDTETRARRIATTKISVKARFGRDYDPELWTFGEKTINKNNNNSKEKQQDEEEEKLGEKGRVVSPNKEKEDEEGVDLDFCGCFN